MGEMTEPVRTNLYECVLRVLQHSKRITNMIRIIYCGEHQFGDKCDMSFQEAMENIIETVNSEHCYNPITGLLIVYPNYFVHIIDGSEGTIAKHFKLLISMYKPYLGRMKLLVVYNHSNQRFFTTWAYRSGKPPTLLERINPESDEEETFRQLEICLQKIYNLAKKLRIHDIDSDEITIRNITPDMIVYLPEYLLLDFLLGSDYLDDVSSYANIYMTVPDINLRQESIWPIKMDYIPRDIFDVEQDVIPELPKE